MENVIKELVETAIFYEELAKDYESFGHIELMQSNLDLAKEYRKAISVLEKAGNNTGS